MKILNTNYGVMAAVIPVGHAEVIRLFDFNEEYEPVLGRVYYRTHGVTFDDAGEVCDLTTSASDDGYDLEVTHTVITALMFASAIAKKFKIGGLDFGGKVILNVRVPSALAWHYDYGM